MFKNYLKIAFRNLSQSVIINLLGLSVGLALSIYIFIYIQKQVSFDGSHTNASKTYRVLADIHHSTGVMKGNLISTRQSERIEEGLPFIELSTSLSQDNKVIVKTVDQIFYEDQLITADSNFFKVFAFKLLEGNRQTALHSPDHIIISNAIAVKYFGEQSALGQTLLVNNKEYQVEGVIEKTKNFSHLDIQLLASNMSETHSGMWLTKYFVSTTNNKEEMEGKLSSLFTEDSDQAFKFSLQPLTEIHLHTHAEIRDFSINGSIEYIYTLGSIAILILITVCFNYTNVALAKYLKRVKEIGMRKINGATRKQIIIQLMSETFLYVFAASLLSGLILELLSPYLNNWIKYEVTLTYLDPKVIGLYSSVLILITLGAGYYPAHYITSIKSKDVLTGRSKTQFSKIGLIRLLVAIQFVISAILLSSAVIMQQQMDFINKKDLGINTEGIIALDTEGKISEIQYEALKVKLLENPKVKQVVAGPLPGRTMTTAIQNNQNESFDIHIAYILDDYPEFLDVEIIDGHSFDFNRAINDSEVIVNEEAYRLLGLNDQNNTFFYNELNLQTFMSTRKEMKVIGVMKDYHFANFKNKIEPLFFQISDSKGLKEQIGIKYSNAKPEEILALISSAWQDLNIEQPLSYHFLTDSYNNFHREENSIASGFKYISYLAIILSALGLFGLSSLDVKRSFKNISIKKVLGASSDLISREYLKSYLSLALLCSLIGLSFAFFLIQSWLEMYVYRFEVDIMTFTLPVLLMLIIAVASIFYNVFTAASVNPVENLKKE